MHRRAEHQPARPQGANPEEEEDVDARPEVGPRAQGAGRRSAAAWRLHPRGDGHAEEAELGASQDREGSSHERARGDELHPGGGAQPPGALRRSRSRWPRQGSAWRPLQGRPRRARRGRGLRPQAGPLALRSEGQLGMPRRNQATIRPLEPDSVYRSRLVQQIVNKVMQNGKKSLAEQITYDALALVGERTGSNPVEELEGAIKQLTPVLEVRSRRVGGATYQVPVEVPARRARTLAVRWLVEFAKRRGEK